MNRYPHIPLGDLLIDAFFTGGRMSSDAGLMLFRELEKRTRIIARFVACFTDYRTPSRIKHSIWQMVCQRVYGLLAGYEDVNDQDTLRYNPVIEAVSREALMDFPGFLFGKTLASSKTINRLELGGASDFESAQHRYKKIAVKHDMMAQLIQDFFFEQKKGEPEITCLDVDTTDLELHGDQQGSLFHGYYKCHCYLPLYIFCGHDLLCSQLLTIKDNEIDACLQKVQEIVAKIRRRWPNTKIQLRGDSGFCRDQVLSWCEQEGIEYVFGLAQNARLLSELEPTMDRVRKHHQESGKKQIEYAEWEYRTLDSWSANRRVVGKAECQKQGDNPRFVVSNISKSEKGAQEIYEYYCQRGDIENRIKEQKQVYCGRMSTSKKYSNQTRLYYSAIVYMLMNAFRRLGLSGTKYAKAQCKTIREKLIKMPAKIELRSKKRLEIKIAEDKEQEKIYAQILRKLQRISLPAPG